MTTPLRVALPLLAIALTGCAFSGGPVGAPPSPKSPADAGTLVIYRNASPVGLFGTMRVSLGGQPVYKLGMGQSYSMQLDPGHYFLDYSIGLNQCGGMVEVRRGETLNVRLAPDCMLHENRGW